jgi:hypothetical protein
MTAKELFDKMLEENDECTSTEMMIAFAELKCKELLEIVAEKAETKPYSTSTSIDFSKLIVNKDSILNAVDLKEFIK